MALAKCISCLAPEGGVHKDSCLIQTKSVLMEADQIINGERQQVYGPPKTSFQRIGDLWSTVLGVPNISAEQVALCLIQLKISRAVGNLEFNGGVQRDTLVDIAGYAGCIELFGGRDV